MHDHPRNQKWDPLGELGHGGTRLEESEPSPFAGVAQMSEGRN